MYTQMHSWCRRQLPNSDFGHGSGPEAFRQLSSREGSITGLSREVLERGEGGGERGLVYQKWPNKSLPIVNFVFSHYGHFGRGGGPVGDTPLLLLCTAILILPWGSSPFRLGSKSGIT